jgi:hydrogenase maturation protease
MNSMRIVILVIGCTLLADQGFGVRVVHCLERDYDFPESVQLIDGGLVGVALLGLIANADHLIVIDAICDNGAPGDIYRLEGPGIFERFKARNHVQQVEFLEALAHCQALDTSPRAVLLGIEPQDTERLTCELTPLLEARTGEMMARVVAELDRLNVPYRKKTKDGNACA